jgi:hypothetical protein
VRIKPFLSRATTSPSPVGAGHRAEEEEEEQEREGQALTAPECDRLALAYETSVCWRESDGGTMPRAMSSSSTAIGRTSLW